MKHSEVFLQFILEAQNTLNSQRNLEQKSNYGGITISYRIVAIKTA
jgi:hypothetical protein